MAKTRVAGEVFSGYNKPKRDVQGGKQFAVAAKEGDKVRFSAVLAMQTWKIAVTILSAARTFVLVTAVMRRSLN